MLSKEEVNGRPFYSRYHRCMVVQVEFKMPSLTEQHHKDDCDVNVILKRFMRTGQLPANVRQSGVYGDFSGCAEDYREAVSMIQDAQDRFSSLPSAVRERFGNDPEQLLQFLDDPANRKEAEKLGLLATVPGSTIAPARDETRAGAGSEPAPGAEAEHSAGDDGK